MSHIHVPMNKSSGEDFQSIWPQCKIQLVSPSVALNVAACGDTYTDCEKCADDNGDGIISASECSQCPRGKEMGSTGCAGKER